jgi:hypothetical protein
MGSPAYIQQKQRCTSYTTQGASIAPPPAPPSGGGGGPPPPAPGGGGPPTGLSCPSEGVHSSSPQALLLAALWPAMVVEPLHTAPGSSHPGYASTCPQAHPATPSPDDDVCHQNPLSTTAGGACDGPAPGSSNRRLLAALSGSAGHPATSSHRRLSPCGSLSGSR